MNAPGAVKPRPPGSTKEVVDTLVDCAGGPKVVAFMLGKSPSAIAGYTDPEIPTHMNYDQVRRLTMHGHTLAAEDLAQLAGGVFVPLTPEHMPVSDRIVQYVREGNDLNLTIAQALADGKACDADRKAMSQDAKDLVRVLVRLISTLDGNNKFAGLHAVANDAGAA